MSKNKTPKRKSNLPTPSWEPKLDDQGDQIQNKYHFKNATFIEDDCLFGQINFENIEDCKINISDNFSNENLAKNVGKNFLFLGNETMKILKVYLGEFVLVEFGGAAIENLTENSCNTKILLKCWPLKSLPVNQVLLSKKHIEEDQNISISRISKIQGGPG